MCDGSTRINRKCDSLRNPPHSFRSYNCSVYCSFACFEICCNSEIFRLRHYAVIINWPNMFCWMSAAFGTLSSSCNSAQKFNKVHKTRRIIKLETTTVQTTSATGKKENLKIPCKIAPQNCSSPTFPNECEENFDFIMVNRKLKTLHIELIADQLRTFPSHLCFGFASYQRPSMVEAVVVFLWFPQLLRAAFFIVQFVLFSDIVGL